MKYFAAILLALAIATPVQAQLTVPQGGTGTTTVPSGWFLTGSSALRLVAQQFIDLASDITGTLGVGNGGTGATSFDAGELLYGSGTGAIGTVASTTVSCAGSVSCSTFTVLGATPFTITGTDTTGLATTSPWTAGQLAQVVDNGRVQSIATSSLGLLTTNVAEGSNLYFTNDRARDAISLTTTGTSGASTYNDTTGVLNIPQYIDTDTTYTAAYPITLTGTTFGLAFGTTTSNTWAGTQTFSTIVASIADFTAGVLRATYSAALSLATNGDIGIDSTSNQFRYYSGGASRVLGNGNFYPAFTYATSTAWTATTTIPLGTAYVGETWNGVQCFTDAGTVNVSFYDGTNRMDLLNASTTVGTVAFTTNNTFTAAEKRYVDIGTPASSPTRISCTVSKSLTAD